MIQQRQTEFKDTQTVSTESQNQNTRNSKTLSSQISLQVYDINQSRGSLRSQQLIQSEPIPLPCVDKMRSILITEQVHSNMILQDKPSYTYYGQLMLGLRCGYGRMYYNDGSYYEGEFLANYKHGYGTMIQSDGSAFQGYFFGDKTIEDFGKRYDENGNLIEMPTPRLELHSIDLPNEKKYIGEIKNGLRSGFGRYYWKDGTFYEGEFSHDQINGFGQMDYSDGKRYKGFWINGKMNKIGKFEWPTGEYYEGEYVNDKKHGFGYFKQKNDVIYKGFFQEGKMHGQGKLIKGKQVQNVYYENGVRIS